MIKKVLCTLFFITSLFANAQEAPQMADAMRENGKIYVVIAVIAIVFLALVGFLIYLERKIKTLEDKLNQKRN